MTVSSNDFHLKEIKVLFKRMKKEEKPVILEKNIAENPYLRILLYIGYSYVGRTFDQIKKEVGETTKFKKLLKLNLVEYDKINERYKLSNDGVKFCNEYILHTVIKNET